MAGFMPTSWPGRGQDSLIDRTIKTACTKRKVVSQKSLEVLLLEVEKDADELKTKDVHF